MSKRFLVLLTASLIVTATSGWQAAFCAAPANAELHEQRMKKGIYEEVLINAPPKVVWQSMQEQRHKDPDSTSVKPAGEANSVEQKFSFPSPFGSADCVLNLADVPAQRVDFSLVQSEDLKAMEGSWVLTPLEDGRCTKLGLSSYVEPNMMIPRLITNALVSHKARRNLAMVKKLAETSHPADKAM